MAVNRCKSRLRVCGAVALSLSLSVGVLTERQVHAAPPKSSEPAAQEAVPEETEEERAKTEKAQQLYKEGSASFSAADYEDAIDKFTAVLRIAETSDSFGLHVRSALLLNLAQAHRFQYRIDKDLKRLRLALDIYDRLLREAQTNQYPPEDVEEAEKKRAELIPEIEEAEAANPTPADPDSGGKDSPARDPKSARNRGLVAGGSVLAAAGIGFIVLGTRYGPRAEKEAEGRTDLDQQQIDDFLATERGKGRSWIIGGAVASAVGVGLLVTGAVLMAKGKKRSSAVARRVTPTLTLDRGYSGVGLVGRF